MRYPHYIKTIARAFFITSLQLTAPAEPCNLQVRKARRVLGWYYLYHLGLSLREIEILLHMPYAAVRRSALQVEQLRETDKRLKQITTDLCNLT